MDQHHFEQDQAGKPASFWSSRGGVALIMLGLVVLFYLLREHWAHLGQAWPYLLLLACPLMHLFLHGSHGHHHRHGSDLNTRHGDFDNNKDSKIG